MIEACEPLIRENLTTCSYKTYILPDRNFLLVGEVVEYGDDSKNEDTSGTEHDTDTEYTSVPEETKITEIPHQRNINNSLVTDNPISETYLTFYIACSH